MRAICAVLIAVAISGCATSTAYLVNESSPHYTMEQAFHRSAYGCRYHSVMRRPMLERVDFTLVLGHGFLRSQRNMRGLATALASAGVSVITLDFCHMKPWNGHHLRNAEEMSEVASFWGAERVVYAGFSAGALAALLAAGSDSRARGLVLLDFVDQPPIGQQVLSTGLNGLPVLAITAAPSSCNVSARDMPLLEAVPELQLKRFPEASHCAFESPTNWLCNLLCGADRQADARLRSLIIARVVSAVLELHRRASSEGKKPPDNT